MVQLNVDLNTVITRNRLQLGVQVDQWGGERFITDSIFPSQAQAMNSKMIRNMVYRNKPYPNPCTSWDSSTSTGTFDWTYLDSIVNEIRRIGAEPLLVLAHAASLFTSLPTGMTQDPSTGLPYPSDFGAYCAYFASHFIGKVKYYDVINEPQRFSTFGSDTVALANAVNLYVGAYNAIKAADPNAKVSWDGTVFVRMLDYYASQGIPMDYYSFHHYPGYQPSGSQSFRQIIDDRAPRPFFGTTIAPPMYSVEEARSIFQSYLGFDPEVIIGETNYNSTTNPPDPLCKQIEGVIYDAITILWSMELGVNHRLHYAFTGGLGIVNDNTGADYLPMTFYKMIGPNLAVNDSIYSTSSDNERVLVIAWRNGASLTIMVINKDDVEQTINISGVSGSAKFEKLTPVIPWDTPYTITGSIDFEQPFILEGRSVMLIQSTPTFNFGSALAAGGLVLVTTGRPELAVIAGLMGGLLKRGG